MCPSAEPFRKLADECSVDGREQARVGLGGVSSLLLLIVILALESSCDETAVALFDPATGSRGEWIHSQIALHEKHGGVVPDLATREHLRHFGPLLARVRAAIGFENISEIA